MVTDQKHSSDISSEQEVIRYTEKLAQAFGLNEQNAKMYSTLSGENRVLVKRLDDYYSQHRKLKKKVNRLEKYVEEHLNWLTEDVGELFDTRHCNCSKKTINSPFETSSFKTDSSEESGYKKVKPRRNLT
jgi:hypothetical protein